MAQQPTPQVQVLTGSLRVWAAFSAQTETKYKPWTVGLEVALVRMGYRTGVTFIELAQPSNERCREIEQVRSAGLGHSASSAAPSDRKSSELRLGLVEVQ